MRELKFCIGYSLGTCKLTMTECMAKNKTKHVKFYPNWKPQPKAAAPGPRDSGYRAKTPPPNPAEIESRKSNPCPFLAKGHCTWGDKCHWLHPTGGKVAAMAALVTADLITTVDGHTAHKDPTTDDHSVSTCFPTSSRRQSLQLCQPSWSTSLWMLTESRF